MVQSPSFQKSERMHAHPAVPCGTSDNIGEFLTCDAGVQREQDFGVRQPPCHDEYDE
jgi:hypothetical protein